VADCCQTNGDCNDGRSCTVDTCDATTHTCSHDAPTGCCTSNADCAGLCAFCDLSSARCSTDPGCANGTGGSGGGSSTGTGGNVNPGTGGTTNTLPDGGFEIDSGTDAGSGSGDKSKCACSAPGRADTHGALFGIAALALVAVRRRRRAA
jgi:MYXO-CTERM domain-containing protein